MNVPVVLLNSTGGNPFEQVSKPVAELLNMALTPTLRIVEALEAIYHIFLGAKLAKAEESQDREKTRDGLKNATIGFMLIFVFIVVLKVGMNAMSNWINSAMNNVTP